MNSVNLVGRLSREPELRFTNSGKAVTNFTLAVRDPFDKDGNADFIPCVVWENMAELLAETHTTGDMVAVQGRIKVRSWEDQDENTRYTTEVIVNQVTLIPTKQYYFDQFQNGGNNNNNGNSNSGNGNGNRSNNSNTNRANNKNKNNTSGNKRGKNNNKGNGNSNNGQNPSQNDDF